MARSKVYGVPKLRRTLRRLPETVTAGVKAELRRGAEDALAGFRAGAPSSSVRDQLGIKYARDGLTARVGLIGKRANRKGFLGRIFEFGAKAHTIAVRGLRRGRAKRSLVTKEGVFLGKQVSHPGMGARPWFYSSWKPKKPRVIARIKDAIGKAIARASGS